MGVKLKKNQEYSTTKFADTIFGHHVLPNHGEESVPNKHGLTIETPEIHQLKMKK